MASAIRDYAQLAKDILKEVGGQDNLKDFSRCATRLRLILKEVPEGAADKIKQMPGVITVVIASGQFQVVLGTHVADVFANMGNLVDKSFLSSGEQKTRVLDAVIASMSAIFAPLLFILASAGILQGALIVTKHFFPDVVASGTFEVLNFLSWTPFSFLPVFIGFTAAKYFRCNPYIAVLCCCALINPSWAEIAGKIASGEAYTFLGLPLAKTVYSSSVLPPIFLVWALSYVERYTKQILPDVVKELFTPLVCMIIMVPVTLVVIGPVTSAAAAYIAVGYNWLYNAAPPVAAAVVGGFWQVLVIFGIHWGTTPLVFANYEQFGKDSFQVFQTCAVVAQMVAAFVCAYKSKNTIIKKTGYSAGITAIFGITEPTLYGITLRFKKPFICGCIGGAAGSLVASLFDTHYYVYAGLSSIITTVNAITPENPYSFIGMLAGVGVTFVVTTVLIFVIGFDDPKEETTNEAAPASAKSVSPQPEVTSASQQQVVLASPVKGIVVPLSTVNDETFAQKMLGDGVAIKPEEGLVTAPCDAVVSSVIESQHAVGLTCANGMELLIHVGLDTVALKGEFFDTLVSVDQVVKAGEPLIRFDLEAVKAAGYDVTTPFIVLNSDEFKLQILDEEEHPIEMGEPVIQIA